MGKSEAHSKAVTALVLGIVGLVCLLSNYTLIIALVCSILAIVFGKKVMNDTDQEGMAKAGFICGIIGCVITAIRTVILIVALIALFKIGSGIVNESTDLIEEGLERTQDILKDSLDGMEFNLDDLESSLNELVY